MLREGTELRAGPGPRLTHHFRSASLNYILYNKLVITSKVPSWIL